VFLVSADSVVDTYDVRVSSATRDPDWDRFISAAPGGHHLQSSYWGAVKAALGWRVVRVLVTSGGCLRAGAQLLVRRLPALGSIGYVALGPVLDRDDDTLHERTIDGVLAAARDDRTLLLVVQPPAGQERTGARLRARGFRRAGHPVEPYPTTTVVADLSATEDSLLAAMKPKTRYNIRLAQRRGVRVREGDDHDVATFHRLLTTTGQRQGFGVPSRDYFAALMRIMAPGGHAKIFLAEVDGRPLSAALVIPFGRTVSYKRGAWSGTDGHLHPNELLHWSAMRWAKRQGYRYYDFEGIEPPSAPARRSVTEFKLGFGGDVVRFPAAYERIANPALRGGYRLLAPVLLESAAARRLLDAIRTRGPAPGPDRLR
jgi:lipid II:glycine glycyltransferase (peptidoglycan interpeptide bridge formation enzyme)